MLSSARLAPPSSARSARSNVAMATGRCATSRSSPTPSSCSSSASPSTCAALPSSPPSKPEPRGARSAASTTRPRQHQVPPTQTLQTLRTGAINLYSAEASLRVRYHAANPECRVMVSDPEGPTPLPQLADLAAQAREQLLLE